MPTDVVWVFLQFWKKRTSKVQVQAFFGLGLYKTSKRFLKLYILRTILGSCKQSPKKSARKLQPVIFSCYTCYWAYKTLRLQCKGGYFSLHCPACLAGTECDKQVFFDRKWTAERLLLIASSPLLFVLRDGKPPMLHFPHWTPWSIRTCGREGTKICTKASGLFLKSIYCCSMKHQCHNPSPQRLKLAKLLTVLYYFFTHK